MKYIVVKKGGTELPFVFSNLIQHSDMARKVGGTVVGAGFSYIRDDRYECVGESVSCRVASRGEEDAKILNRHLVL